MLNKVILIGNLGKDPEVRFMPNGNAVTTVSIATSKKYKDKEGQLVEKTEWHSVVLFNQQAKFVGEYLKKGEQVYVEGELRTRQWEKDGEKRYTTEIVASEVKPLGGKQADKQEKQPEVVAEEYNDNIPF